MRHLIYGAYDNFFFVTTPMALGCQVFSPLQYLWRSDGEAISNLLIYDIYGARMTRLVIA
jgi:hypothetical protein